MKKTTIIVLSIVLIVLLGLGWFTYRQWNTISAFIDSVRYSNEELTQQLEDNKKKVDDFLAQEEDITVRDLTEEESKALNEGNLTEEEIIELLVGTPTQQPTASPVVTEKPETTSKPEENTQQPIATPPQTATPAPQESSGQIVAKLIAKLYVQKSTYLNKLDVIEAEAREAYMNLPYDFRQDNDETKLSDGKKQLLQKFLPIVASWETECDNVVGEIIDEIRAELKKSGKGTEIADTLYESYLNEKKTKKAYFINRYMD